MFGVGQIAAGLLKKLVSSGSHVIQVSLQAGDRLFSMTKLRTEILDCLRGPVDDIRHRRFEIVDPVLDLVGQTVQFMDGGSERDPHG